MKTKKYIILAAISTLFIFGTSWLCNMCTAPSIDISDPSVQGQTDRDISDNENEVEDNINIAEEGSDENLSTPKIELEVYRGPVYSEQDDVTFYRIKAIVTGNPKPEVKFSKDDSEHAWGPLKVQVNLKRGEKYKLVATAENSEGMQKDSVLLSWDEVIHDPPVEDDDEIAGVDQEEDQDQGNDNGDDGDHEEDADIGGPGDDIVQEFDVIEAEDLERATYEIPSIREESGYFIIGQQGETYYGEDLYIGDTGVSDVISNQPCSGFVIFDISVLEGMNINEAYIQFEIKEKLGDTSFYDYFSIRVLEDDIMRPVFEIDSDDLGNFLLGDQEGKFVGLINNAIDRGQQNILVDCSFIPFISDEDNSWDGWVYRPEEIYLTVVRYLQ